MTIRSDSAFSTASGTLATVAQLRARLDEVPAWVDQPAWPGPWPTVDRVLLRGGLRPGMLVDWLATVRGSTAGLLALLAARSVLLYRPGLLVVVDRPGVFYPPPALAWGIDNRRLLVVRPASDADQLWTLVQVLRSPAVAVVWSTLAAIDDRAFRSLQLAAEAGGSPAMLVRPANLRGRPTWSHAQLQISPHAAPVNTPRQGCRWVDVTTTRLRGSHATGSVTLRIDETSGVVGEAA